jgi:hypothetical protein
MNDELLPEEQTQVSDGEFTFRGKALEKFSFDRQAAAQRIGDDSGAENDALLVYLCLTPIERVRQLRGAGPVRAFLAEVADWCDREKITIHKANKGRQQVSDIANRIYADLALADFAPETKGDKETPSPNATG